MQTRILQIKCTEFERVTQVLILLMLASDKSIVEDMVAYNDGDQDKKKTLCISTNTFKRRVFGARNDSNSSTRT
jgi:hypothetical protein